VVSSESQDSLIGSRVIYGIAFGKKKDCYYRRFKKKNSDYFYSKFSFYRKLVKATIKSDRFRQLKSIDGNLKSQSKQFWKYVGSYRKRNSNSIQLEVDGIHLTEPYKLLMLLPSIFSQSTIPLV
jgi:hypothetical protein